MKSRNLLVILFLLFFQISFSQKEYYNWYFSHEAAITFINGSPVSLSNSKAGFGEASSTISDKNGNLLCYTLGMIVYNKNHEVMKNGDNLLGHYSSTQVQIIPQPGNDSIYYVFTVDAAENHLINGLRYSIININSEFGDGEVISKNIPLLSSSTEKVAYTYHSNGIDYWVVAHSWKDNRFHAFLLDSDGLHTDPVISAIGAIHEGGVSNPQTNNYTNSIGYLRFSKSGEKLAVAIHYDGLLQLFSFDRLSGKVSNLIASTNGYQYIYALEFSESENYLYAGTLYNNSSLFQFDIHNNDLQHVTTIVNPQKNNIFALQMGPDGKIYVAHQEETYLGVIQFPENPGLSCNYIQNAITLINGTCHRGLPLYLAPPSVQVDFKMKNNCYSDYQSFSIVTSVEPDSVLWNFGDPASGNDNTSTDTLGIHHFPSPGTYEVQLTVYASGIQGKTKKKINLLPLPRIDLGNDTVLCEGEEITIDVSASSGTYKWSDGTTSPIKTITRPGDYSVEVTNSCGTASDTIGVIYSIIPDLMYSGDTTVCLGEEIVIRALEKSGIIYNWSTGEHTSSISVKPLTNTQIGLIAENEYGCRANYYLNLNTINCYYEIEIPNVFTPNQDNINDFWIIKNIEHYPKAEVYIYTRWGKEIFRSKGYETPWDGIYNGKILLSGTYYYVIILNNGTPAYTGNVSIYR